MTLGGSVLRWGVLLIGGLAVAALSPTACSAGGDNADDDDGVGNSGTGAGGGLGMGGQGQGGGEACVAETFPGELAPLDLYVLLDKSGSMNDDNKWGSVTGALQTFINAPESSGIGVGLAFFPMPPAVPPPTVCDQVPDAPDCGIYGPCRDLFCPLQQGVTCCYGNLHPDASCVVTDYQTPAATIAELPGAASGLISAISGASSNGGATPTLFAMEAAVAYTKTWAADHPTHLTYIVLATDGMPEGCGGPDELNPVNSVPAVATMAQQAATDPPAVPTFVIGVGDQLSELNQIAAAGGTNQAYLVDAGATQQFIDALIEIRAMGVCTFLIPEAEGGQEIDFDRVNVTLIDPDNTADRVTLPYVGDIASCHPTEGGWYYDNVATPTKILLCPSSCEHVRITDWNIEIELGCRTVTR
ncbi:MAG: hypothetical protein JRI55_34910 [Deltaproteobacteria bacterium]|jgi:hypothetical protein|nr:hypothetical protein [Deltaproteobacteria bacterium]